MARLVGLNDYHAALWGSRIRFEDQPFLSTGAWPSWLAKCMLLLEPRAERPPHHKSKAVSAAHRMRSPLSFRRSNANLDGFPDLLLD